MTAKRDPEATRAALLSAAETLFIQKGFGNTALSEIARHAGVTKSLIHHYFESKEKLWHEVKQRRIRHYLDKQMEMLEESEPTAGLLEDSIRFYFWFLVENPQIVRILAWMFLEGDRYEDLHQQRELTRAGVQRIKEAQNSGEIRDDVDPRFILFTFLGLVQHWIQDKEHFISDFGKDDLGPALDGCYLSDMLKIFMEGVLPR